MKLILNVRTQLGVLLGLIVLCSPLVSATSYAQGLADIAGKINLPKKAEKEKTDTESKKETPRHTGPKKRIAVMDMEVKITTTGAMEPTTSGGVVTTTTVSIAPPSDFGTGLTEMLTTALVGTGRFIVLERKALSDILTEQQLATSGAVDPSSAPMSGKLLGAQALVRGAVTEYTYHKTSTSGSASFLEGIGVGTSSAEAAVVLDVRLYDCTTGQIMDSVKAEGRAKSSATAVSVDKEDLQMSASQFKSSPLGHATRQAIERACAAIVKRMEKIRWEGRVAEVDIDESECVTTVYINAGSRCGLKAADRFEIFRPGRQIVDPETKLVIGRAKDKRLGSCRIESLTKHLAIAEPLDGEGFQINDVVRLIETKPPKKKSE